MPPQDTFEVTITRVTTYEVTADNEKHAEALVLEGQGAEVDEVTTNVYVSNMSEV